MRATPSTINRAIANGGYVLVEFNNGSYGLYQYSGAGGTLNLATENYANTSHWTKVVAARSTDDTGGDLQHGHGGAGQDDVERVAFQLMDDVNVTVGPNSLVATADGSIAIGTPGRPERREGARRRRHADQGRTAT